MNIEDLLNSPQNYPTQTWQMGAKLCKNITENSLVLIFCTEYRGANIQDENLSAEAIREAFYQLGEHQNPCQVIDLGDLILGKTLADTQLALSEVIYFCLSQKAIPVVIGGSEDLNHAMAEALAKINDKIHYANISPMLAIENDDSEEVNQSNYLDHLLSQPELNIKQYSHLAYQEHLNSLDKINKLKSANCDVLKLSEMMWQTENGEPYLRYANMISLNADALESINTSLSINPQVNGLNHREICAYAKTIGMAPYLQTFGLWNIALHRLGQRHAQLLAQILWYFIDGVGIRLSHPSPQETETFVVMLEHQDYVFQRNIFKNQWYFGKNDDLAQCLPCSQQDYLMAKQGKLSPRLEKQIKLYL